MTNETTSKSLWCRGLKWLSLACAAAVLVACGGGGGDSSGGEGTLRVALTDAPSCGYDHVYVTVEKVRVHLSAGAADSDAGWREVVLSPARRVDLLSLTNGVLEELGTTPLPAGRYSQVRLVLAENTGAFPLANAIQPTGGALIALDTPSAQQSGLKMQAHFDVAANQIADLVLDFDACQSIVKRGNSGRYGLKPVVAVLQRVVGGVEGYVATALPLASTTVSLQQGGTVIRSTAPDASGRFFLPYLADGAYTLVVVSEGRATAVVTNVPVTAAAGKTVINASATGIVSPPSAMRDVTGTTSVTQGSESAVLGDAQVRALQALTGGPVVEVRATQVDADLGTYRLSLPVAAPVRASYVPGAALSFTADASVAGKYSIQARASGRSALESPADISSAPAAVNFAFTP
jgi:hypothetical protein